MRNYHWPVSYTHLLLLTTMFAVWAKCGFWVSDNRSAVRADTLNIIQSGIILITAVSANVTVSTEIEALLLIQILIAVITEPKNIVVFKFVCRKLIPTIPTDCLLYTSRCV